MRAHPFRLAAVLLCWAAAIAACGGADKATATSDARNFSTGLQLSECMRSHGVPNYPDPSAGGDIQLSGGINPQSPAFQSAQQKCEQFAPFKDGPPTMSESQRRAAVRFAECMRANGQTGFPDPTLVAPPGATRVLVLRGMVFAFKDEIDPKSTAFGQAATKCGVTPP